MRRVGAMSFEEVQPAEEVLSAIEAYCEALRVERNCSPHTVRAYHGDLCDFGRWAARNDVDALHAQYRQLRAYLGELASTGSSRNSINRHLSSLRGFFRWMNVVGLTDANPASVLQGPRKQQHLPHVVRAAEMERLLTVYADRDFVGNPRKQSPSDMRNQAFLEFLYACGARISEASGLQMENVDFAQGCVKVLGKGSKERIVPLHDTALDAMKRYLLKARPVLLGEKYSPYFFVSSRGNQWSTDAMRKEFKKAVQAAGLDESFSPHDMRHTFATDVLNGEADLRSVQDMLGHASLSTTQIYTHASAARLKQVHTLAHPRA